MTRRLDDEAADSTRMPPLLLISVRNADEAAIAIENGADIIDIKDPSRGPLGRADERAVASIVRVVDQPDAEYRPPITMALGELQEIAEHAVSIPAGVSAVKLGLAGCRDHTGWRSDWASVRSRLETDAHCTPEWVAVVYADDELAHAPLPADVIEAAAGELSCCGVLVDTFSKTAGRLWDFVEPSTLKGWAHEIHENGMFLAVGGSIGLDDLSRLAEIPLDIVAVRGSVCSGSRRESALDGGRIREFRQSMALAWNLEQPFVVRRNRGSRIVSLSGVHQRFVDCAPNSK